MINNGDWGLGIGDWAQSPIPNPQSPIPNPQSPFYIFDKKILNKNSQFSNFINMQIFLRLFNKLFFLYERISQIINH